jgi:membrane protein DedA with SNARE-associated domain
MTLVENLFVIFGTYSSLISFFGAFIAGAETIFVLAMLATQGVMPLWIVFVFCSLGIFTADLMWFSIGKIKKLSHLKKIPYVHEVYKKSIKIINKTPNLFILLSLTKFVYGIGIPIIMYLGRRKMKYKQFIKYNALIILMWTTGIVLIGWLAGKGFTFFYDTFQNIKLALLIVLIAIVVLLVLKTLIEKFLFFEAKKLKT